MCGILGVYDIGARDDQTTANSLAPKKLFGITVGGQVARPPSFRRSEPWHDDRGSLTNRRVEAAVGGAAE